MCDIFVRWRSCFFSSISFRFSRLTLPDTWFRPPFLRLACAQIVDTRFLELAMSLLDFSPWIPLGTFSILLCRKSVIEKTATLAADEMGAPLWRLALCLLLSWIIVVCCLIKGVKSSGKVSVQIHLALFFEKNPPKKQHISFYFFVNVSRKWKYVFNYTKLNK